MLESGQDQIIKFIDCYIETETCNLKCHYCYIAQQEKFKNTIVELEHTPAEIRQALSKERLGGTCLINICAGGETLLGESILPTVKMLLKEGHYVMIVTNGTMTQRLGEIVSWDNTLLSHLFIKFSFHYLEMLRLNMMDAFINNVNVIASSACSYTVEVTPNDELIPHINELKSVCEENFGAACHVTIARDDRTGGIELLSEHTLPEFYDIWRIFNSKLLDYKYSIFKKKRTEFCHAGVWSYWMDLNSGEYKQCYAGNVLGNIYENVTEKLIECPVGNKCGLAHCYNGHAFLTMGDIPGLDTASYAEIRNRLEGTEKEWLKPKMKAAMSCKLYETNYDDVDFFSYDKDRKMRYLDYCNSVKNKYQLMPGKRNVFIIGSPNHGNLGDQAIWYATQKLLEKFFKDANVVDINMSDFETDIEAISYLIQNQDIIILQGGGNFGNYYMDDEMIRRYVATRFQENRIIMFPQTVYFSNDENGKKELEKSVRVYGNNINLTLIARDKKSYEILHENFKNDIYMLPDVALSLKYINENINRKGVLLCFRSDSESIMDAGKVKDIEIFLKGKFEEVRYTDTQAENYEAKDREILLMNKLEEFQAAELVVTDRLHGMVFSVITGTPCIVYDNFNEKVRNVYSYLKQWDYIKMVHNKEEFQTACELLRGRETFPYDESFVLEQFTEVLEKIVDQTITQGQTDDYLQNVIEVFNYWNLKHHNTISLCSELRDINMMLEKQMDDRLEELNVYKDWVNNLKKQVDDRLEELNVYKDWVNNLQKQNDEKVKELGMHKGWLNKLKADRK